MNIVDPDHAQSLSAFSLDVIVILSLKYFLAYVLNIMIFKFCMPTVKLSNVHKIQVVSGGVGGGGGESVQLDFASAWYRGAAFVPIVLIILQKLGRMPV